MISYEEKIQIKLGFHEVETINLTEDGKKRNMKR